MTKNQAEKIEELTKNQAEKIEDLSRKSAFQVLHGFSILLTQASYDSEMILRLLNTAYPQKQAR